MRADEKVAFLAGLAGEEAAEQVRGRLRLRREKRETRPAWQLAHELHRGGMPASALLWMLERDEPDVNVVVYHHPRTDRAVQRDILRGIPYGPGRTGRLKVADAIGGLEEPDIPAARSRHGLIGNLRLARTMGQGRAAALAVERANGGWEQVAEADLEQPLPGYARWALSLRIDCPPELRTQFGGHRKFEYRLRQAGIVSGPREYVEGWRPARQVLGVLWLGRHLFPERVEEAGRALRPLIRAELGADGEAWAVLAQLLPTFSGTLPELIRTAGAVTHGAA